MGEDSVQVLVHYYSQLKILNCALLKALKKIQMGDRIMSTPIYPICPQSASTYNDSSFV